MSESVVELTYRGLSIDKGVRLSRVRPSTGFLEVPAPLPVGTSVAVVAAGGGVRFVAEVVEVREQISSGERPGVVAGMRIAPRLEDDAARGFWAGLVVEPDDAPTAPVAAVAPVATAPVVAAPVVAAPVVAAVATAPVEAVVASSPEATAPEAASPAAPTVRMTAPRIPMAPVLPAQKPPPGGRVTQPMATVVAGPALVDDGRRTEIMAAVVPPELAGSPERELADLASVPVAIEDDGRRTEVMAAVVPPPDEPAPSPPRGGALRAVIEAAGSPPAPEDDAPGRVTRRMPALTVAELAAMTSAGANDRVTTQVPIIDLPHGATPGADPDDSGEFAEFEVSGSSDGTPEEVPSGQTGPTGRAAGPGDQSKGTRRPGKKRSRKR